MNAEEECVSKVIHASLSPPLQVYLPTLCLYLYSVYNLLQQIYDSIPYDSMFKVIFFLAIHVSHKTFFSFHSLYSFRVSLAKDDTSAGRPEDAAPSSARSANTISDGLRP